MCLLIAKPLGVSLPRDWRDQCAAAADCNPDGFGYSVFRPGWKRPKILRSVVMTADQFAESSAEYCTPETESIIHFRFGTSGGTRKELCHPFRIADGSTFAHNGVLPIIPTPGLSDTATIAESCANVSTLLENLRRYVNASNKFALIPADGGLEVIGEEHGEWENDIWYSNGYWRSYQYDFGRTYDSADLSWDEMQYIEDELTALVERFGLSTVEEYLKFLRSNR